MTSNIIKPTTALARRATTTRRVPNPGVTKLRKKADEVVGTNSDKIAEALAKGAEEGNASSARLLVDLADNANWTEHSDSVATVISLALTEWKKEPQSIELQTTPNPPKLKPPPPQLTSGKSGAAGSESGSETDSPDACAEAVIVDGQIVAPESEDTSVPSP